jgi:CRP-like cAMP-binding protein
MISLAAFIEQIACGRVLSPGELTFLRGLWRQRRTIPRKTDLFREGMRATALFVLFDGWAAACKHSENGRRQIVNPLIPGDVLGFSQLFRHEAHYGAVTLSRASVGMLGREQIDFAFHHHPRLYFGLMGRAMVQHEIIVERLTDVAQHCATTRIAHFAMELLVRHQAVGLAEQGAFHTPLTQGDIADTLGLSIIHVNRVLQSLKRQCLLHWSGRSVVIPDAEKLARIAQFHNREWQIGNWLDLSWIGGGRPGTSAEPRPRLRDALWQNAQPVWGS